MGFAVVVASALTGLVVLRMYFSLFCGRPDTLSHSDVRFGLAKREAYTFVAVVIALFPFGIAPRPLVDSRFAASDDILTLRETHICGLNTLNRNGSDLTDTAFGHITGARPSAS
jgi:NADH:ubiquinone oxidoreductase subunit 4 (subunit M)